MATKIDQKAYLQKYLGGPSGDKKKKKKKVVKGRGFKIIDDDLDLTKLRALDGDEIDVFDEGEDAPQIAGIIDDRPEELKKLEQFKTTSKWKVINKDDGFNSKLQIQEIKRDVKEIEKENEIVFGKMYSDSEDEKNDSDVSPPRKQKINRSIKRGSDSDASPPRKRQNDSDVSPPRKVKDISTSKKGKHSDSDVSPPRKHRNDASPPRSKHKDNSRQRQRYDSDNSPPRRRKDESDEPPRKKQRDTSSSSKRYQDSASRNKERKSTGYDSDLSPLRKNSEKVKERKKPSRWGDADDQTKDRSVHKRQRSRSRSPKNSKNKPNYDSDLSPPRKSRNDSPKRSNKYDKQKNKHRNQNSDSDLSPPRKRKSVSPSRSNRDRYKNSDSPPPTNKKMAKIRSNKAQIEYLCHYMSQHPDFATGDFKTPVGAATMEKQWQRVKEALDKLGSNRSVEQWKICWRDQKRKARVAGGSTSTAMAATGNSLPVPELSQNTQLILESTGVGPTESPIGCWRDQKRKARVEGGSTNKAMAATGNSVPVPELSQNTQLILDTVGVEMDLGLGPTESPIGIPSSTPSTLPMPLDLPTLIPQPSTSKRSRLRKTLPPDRFLKAQEENNRLLKEILGELRISNELRREQNFLMTLEGKMAGLQNAVQLRQENEQFRRKEDEAFKRMTDDISGRNAQVVSRKGKRETSEDRQKQREKAERQKEIDEKYKKWSKGIKQIEAQEARVQEFMHEAAKPLARHRDDRDLESHLRDIERAGDPMLQYIREKRRERGELGPEKPSYKGNFPPNRFNIRPGYRWDGVDRSNGYEKKYFDTQSKRRAQEEEAYKWSTEDL